MKPYGIVAASIIVGLAIGAVFYVLALYPPNFTVIGNPATVFAYITIIGAGANAGLIYISQKYIKGGQIHIIAAALVGALLFTLFGLILGAANIINANTSAVLGIFITSFVVEVLVLAVIPRPASGGVVIKP